MIGAINLDKLGEYILIAISLAVCVLAFFIAKPYIVAMLTGALIAFISYPLHAWLTPKVRFETVSALLIVFLILLLVAIPIILSLNAIRTEAYASYVFVRQKLVIGGLFESECTTTGFICSLYNRLRDILTEPEVLYYIDTASQRISTTIANKVSDIIFSIPAVVLRAFIAFFTMFYLLRDGKRIMAQLEELLPFKKSHRKRIIDNFKSITYAVFFGHLLIAAIQGALGALGFFLFGVPSPILWGIVMAFFALIPFLGTAIVWLPVALLMIFTAATTGNAVLLTKGVFFLLYCWLIVSTIDNILRPKLIGERGKVHPILVLIGVLGGLHLFGFVGIFLGPIALAIFTTLVQIYEEEKAGAATP
ncbi:TPA: AI-2E family transporter [Candidatus Woesearchaeota archaeon]|nr:AI-2E family transporter [Candidatus Woesearchaeota archaeon]HII68640.1 AI-2E family transporter [Candidatus Woesearchaeota archaeon]